VDWYPVSLNYTKLLLTFWLYSNWGWNRDQRVKLGLKDRVTWRINFIFGRRCKLKEGAEILNCYCPQDPDDKKWLSKTGEGGKKLHAHLLWNRNIEEIIEKVNNECRCVLDDAHLLHAPNQQKCGAHIWPLTMCVHCSHNPECIAWIFLSFIKHSFFLAPIVTSTTTWRYWVQHSILNPCWLNYATLFLTETTTLPGRKSQITVSQTNFLPWVKSIRSQCHHIYQWQIHGLCPLKSKVYLQLLLHI